MHQTKVTKHLPYGPDDLFRMVADVDAYPKFLPWVNAMRTWNRTQPVDGVSTVDAEARVGFAIVKEKFATRVRMDEGNRTIEVSLLYGPFRRLRNVWVFVPEAGGTRVEFEIDFEFKSRLLDAILAANLKHAVERLMHCFEARAKHLYGGRLAAGPSVAGAAG